MVVKARRTAGGLAVAGGVLLFLPGTRAHHVLRARVDRALERLRPRRATAPAVTPAVAPVVQPIPAMARAETLQVADRTAEPDATPTAARESVIDLTVRNRNGRQPQPPSSGDREPSETLRHLLDSATSAGIETRVAPRLVRTILATLADRLPPHVRNRVSAQLPSDVCEMFAPLHDARRTGPPRSVPEFVSLVAVTVPDLSREKVQYVTIRVLRTLCSLMPEGQDGVADALPPELRFLWKRAVAV